MALIQIGYENHLATGTLSASSSASAVYDKSNAIAPGTWNAWRPTAGTAHWLKVDMGSAIAADYACIYGLRLTGTQAAKVQSSTDNATWTDRGAAIGSAEAIGGSVWIPFASATARYWRIYLSDGSSFQPNINVAHIGRELQTQQGAWVGFAPLESAREVDALNATSEGGALLGRTVLNRGTKWEIDLQHLTPSWVTNYWLPFMQHAESKPFFLSHPPVAVADGPTATTYCWAEGKIEHPKYMHPSWLSAGMQGRGLR